MSANSNEAEYNCHLLDMYSNSDTFTWKIPNVSSIPQIDGYVVQSPPFSFAGSSWILKMYPYGQTIEGSEGYIDIILERLHYQVNKQSLHVRIFCRDVIGQKINGMYRQYQFIPNTLCTKCKFFRFIQNFKNNPEKRRIAPNDIFTFECELRMETNSGESIQEEIGKRYRRTNNENPEIGHIFKEYSAFKSFYLKIWSKVPTIPDKFYISKQFSFANASWILKMYRYLRTENSNKERFDVVLERLHSEIPEHHVEFEINLAGANKTTYAKSFFFNANHTEGDAINFEGVEGSKTITWFHFDVNMRMMNNISHGSDSQMKSIEPVEGGDSVSGSSAVLQKSTVLQNLKKLYIQQEDCDVVFNVKGKEFKAHRLILKAQSPVLASAFRIDMKEKVTGIFNVEDCEPAIFSDFLHFLYCGEVEKLSKDNVFGLFTVADKYDVSDLRAMCLEFIKKDISVDTFSDTIALALLHSETDLVKLCTDFFTKNLQEIIVTVKWQSFIVENPIQGNELLIKALVPNQRDRES